MLNRKERRKMLHVPRAKTDQQAADNQPTPNGTLTASNRATSEAIPITTRLLNFIEQPLVTSAFGILGGLVGLLFYTPVLIVCGLCVALGFHRAKVVAGKSLWRVQIPAYAVLVVLTIGCGYGLHSLIQSKLVEANISIADL